MHLIIGHLAKPLIDCELLPAHSPLLLRGVLEPFPCAVSDFVVATARALHDVAIEVPRQPCQSARAAAAAEASAAKVPATQHREAKDKVASQRTVQKTFCLHGSLATHRYEVVQTDTNCAPRCIWDEVRAESSIEVHCRREELSD